MEQFLVNFIRRWFWLLGLATLVAATTTYWVSKQQPPSYEAKARLIVGPGVSSASPDLDALRAGGQLLRTYGELATARPFLQAVIDDLHLEVSPLELSQQIEVTSNEETQILSISVKYGDPERAAAIANTAADMLVRMSPSGTGGPEAELKDQVRSQAAMIEESIARTEARIEQLEVELEVAAEAATNAETQGLASGQLMQDRGDGTDERIKQLEADLQAAVDVDKQRLISQQILKESTADSEERIKQLEADLRATASFETQRLILDQMAQERGHLVDLQRADLERLRRMLDQMLQESIARTEERIKDLETQLQAAPSLEIQRLLSDQITQERGYLSDLQRADVEGQRRILDQLVQESVASTEARIAQLEVQLQAAVDVGTQRQIVDQIVQEGKRLADAERTNLGVQREALDQMLEVSVASTEARIAQLEANLPFATSEVETQRIIEQISKERIRLSEDHRTLANLYPSLQESYTNQVRIVEPAIAGTADTSQFQLRMLIGTLAGLLLASAIALAFEYFDDTVKTVEELAEAAGVPILGTIAKHKALHGVGRERLAAWALPDSRTIENYRALLTKLFFSTNDHSPRSILVISPHIDHDTGEIASNLAITLAQSGSRVVLVDANLRRPTVGQLFGIFDQEGLSDLLADTPSQPQLVSVDQAGLSVLPSGPSPLNPFEQLASPRMESLISQLSDQSDVVIIAASPPLLFGESMLLASRVDGVVLAVRRGGAGREVIRDIIENLHLVGARVLGTVLDNNRRRRVSLTSPQKTPSSSAASQSLGSDGISIGSAGSKGPKGWNQVNPVHQAKPGLGD